jgi:hypothetical protein
VIPIAHMKTQVSDKYVALCPSIYMWTVVSMC